METIIGEVKKIGAFEKSFFDFLSIYAKFLVTYICGLFFLLFGFTLFVESAVTVSTQSKSILLAVALISFCLSYMIHSGEIVHSRILSIVILMGNVFGFLFSGIYAIVKIGSEHGHVFSFGGIEKYVFYAKLGGFNIIETMYGYVGGILVIIVMSVTVMYGLSLKDRFTKEGRKLRALLYFLLAILCGLSFFLIIFFLGVYYQSIITYLIYSITGSMLFIYGTNLFKKQSRFLKF